MLIGRGAYSASNKTAQRTQSHVYDILPEIGSSYQVIIEFLYKRTGSTDGIVLVRQVSSMVNPM